ncbi:uncharacterized protein BJX67DRAFT_305374 [Aspergillus lucknowensis]|uniref:Uncharacterized protein n=1 Tax=Aspergillus lucknowensis TaxID=176173 RepID=A0ABR4LZU9_9EURO
MRSALALSFRRFHPKKKSAAKSGYASTEQGKTSILQAGSCGERSGKARRFLSNTDVIRITQVAEYRSVPKCANGFPRDSRNLAAKQSRGGCKTKLESVETVMALRVTFSPYLYALGMELDTLLTSMLAPLLWHRRRDRDESHGKWPSPSNATRAHPE